MHKLDGQYRAAKEALDQSIAAANAHVGAGWEHGGERDSWGAGWGLKWKQAVERGVAAANARLPPTLASHLAFSSCLLPMRRKSTAPAVC